MTVRAVWSDTVLAESDDTLVVEGNHYFPREAVRCDHFQEASTTSVCPWKGTASYYDVVVDGDRDPSAARIKDRVAFWKGVRVSEG